MKVGFGKKGQRPVGFLLIGYVEKAEEFEFVDKTFFTSFCPFGDGAESPDILTEQGYDEIGLALLEAI